MADERLIAEYIVETPLELDKVAAIMAGEQSCGTFTRVAGETDELRARAAAEVLELTVLGESALPSLESQYLQRKFGGVETLVYRQARVKVAFPLANVGTNLTAIAATVGGNLFDLGEVSGMRLEAVHMPSALRSALPYPRHGIAGTRNIMGVEDRPLFGTIIKPNLGMSAEQTAELVATLCEAGADFIKDDEVNCSSAHAPIEARIKAVMAKVRDYRERSGREVMVAFNISDDIDSMRRHAQLVEDEGGNCVMVSLNWCGLAAVQSLRASTGLMIHGHRNGYGAMSRHPLLGMGYQAYQTLYRLTGVDHFHVHGIGGKFCNMADEVVASARHCVTPMAEPSVQHDLVLPVFSSGQWAGTIETTYKAVQGRDFLFLAGGGILAHPSGPAAGVRSLLQGWEACRDQISLTDYAVDHPELRESLAFFGNK